MNTFTGRLVIEQASGEQTAIQKDWTLEEIIGATQNGDYGIISLRGYRIADAWYWASALSIGGGSDGYGIPHVQDGQIIVPTHFRREQLVEPYLSGGEPCELVAVDVMIDPKDIEYVSIVHRVVFDEPKPRLFIAVCTDGGLIATVKTGPDLRALILYVQQECDERFDAQTDDARIFDADGDEVYVFPSPGELEEEGMGVYVCSRCQLSQRVHVDEQVRCETCEADMERLDTLGVNA